MNKLIKKHIIKDFSIDEFDAVESTMDITRVMPDKHGSFTKNQTNGRGKNGRKWESKTGNLFFSVSVKPKNKTPDEIGQLSFVTAITLIATIENVLQEIKGIYAPNLPNDYLTKSLDIKCKWPNDVLINGKKVAGILIESEIDQSKNEMKYVVIGMGVNVIHSPENVMYPATNLSKEGIKIDATDLMKYFVSNFNEVYQDWLESGFSIIRKAWLENAYKLNEEISVNIDNETTTGIFKDLDDTGTLLIEEKNGNIKKILSGDVF